MSYARKPYSNDGIIAGENKPIHPTGLIFCDSVESSAALCMATSPCSDEKSGDLDDAKQTSSNYCDSRRPEKKEDD